MAERPDVRPDGPPDGLAALLERAVPEVCSAAVALVAVGGRVAAAAVAGELVRYADCSGTLAADRPAARRDSLFDLASISKLCTTAAMLSLAEDGLLGLDDPVARWLPAHYAHRPHVTVRHLLTHTAGLQPTRRPDLELPSGSPAERLELVLSTPATLPVGGPYVYSDVGMVTAGRVAEIAGGAPLEELVRERVTGPLGMRDTCYRPASGLLPRIAATECHPGGCLRGQVHDETARALGGVAGHAGLFATADDVLRLGEALRLGGGAALKPATVAEMTRDQGASGAPFRQGLGVRIGDPAIVGPLTDAFGHSGFTGTSLVVDRGLALTVVLLTNAVHPVRGRPGIRELRSAVAQEARALALPAPPRPAASPRARRP
ncbi:serine hydrolase domain-containing protein [Thermoactinospora rubra]|uniref:serine hydrolase domain-containing protein n=1 Tax=Thermoactinospora rubra TaxID=1088767 RepID=UPI001980A78F|nr:serine hydrolase domain-containing protein [Thermoactinospora rubra]